MKIFDLNSGVFDFLLQNTNIRLFALTLCE